MYSHTVQPSIFYFPAALILFMMISAPGLTRSLSQNGASPMANIPMINTMAAIFSFQVASVKDSYPAFNGPMAV